MAKAVQLPVEAYPTRSGLFQEERLRVAGAFAALLTAALILSGGLLWREHTRLKAQSPSPPAAATAR